MKSNKKQMTITIKGKIYVTDLIKMLKNLNILLKEINKSVNKIKTPNIEWRIVNMGFVNDDEDILSITIEGELKRKHKRKSKQNKQMELLK